MIRAVVFDIGGVVIHPRCSKICRLVLAGAEVLLLPIIGYDHKLLRRIRELRSARIVDNRVISIVRGLKDSGYMIPVISNSSPEGIKAMKDMGVYSEFDTVILSSEVGVQKPDKRIFEIAIEKIGVRAEECIFMDDLEKNVKAAEMSGMKGIVYKNPVQLSKDLKKMGVKANGK